MQTVNQMAEVPKKDALERLTVLIDSSTPIVVIETVEEVRAVRMVRAACSTLNLAAFEWSIATGLLRCGNSVGEVVTTGSYELAAQAGHDTLENAKALYNSRDPAAMLANLEGITIEAAFILKDLHRHMDDPVVIRRLRDVGQRFASNRKTIVLTAPKIDIPPELQSLVEFFELPLPDRRRLRQIIDETLVRVSKTHSLQRRLDGQGLDEVAENLRGLTEEEADRAISQALVSRYSLGPELITDVLEAKKALLKRSKMVEFVDAPENRAQSEAWKISSIGWRNGAAPGKLRLANLDWTRPRA